MGRSTLSPHIRGDKIRALPAYAQGFGGQGPLTREAIVRNVKDYGTLDPVTIDNIYRIKDIRVYILNSV